MGAILIAVALAVLAIVWADVHFVLAIFRARQWWDIIPLIGMGIITYSLWWFASKVWPVREQLQSISNVFANLATLLRVMQRHPRGKEFIERMTLPPDEFERQLNQSMDNGS